jgi:hypothetical protein
VCDVSDGPVLPVGVDGFCELQCGDVQFADESDIGGFLYDVSDGQLLSCGDY